MIFSFLCIFIAAIKSTREISIKNKYLDVSWIVDKDGKLFSKKKAKSYIPNKEFVLISNDGKSITFPRPFSDKHIWKISKFNNNIIFKDSNYLTVIDFDKKITFRALSISSKFLNTNEIKLYFGDSINDVTSKAKKGQYTQDLYSLITKEQVTYLNFKSEIKARFIAIYTKNTQKLLSTSHINIYNNIIPQNFNLIKSSDLKCLEADNQNDKITFKYDTYELNDQKYDITETIKLTNEEPFMVKSLNIKINNQEVSIDKISPNHFILNSKSSPKLTIKEDENNEEPIAFSIPTGAMTITGDKVCTTEIVCTNVSIPVPCGETCKVESGNTKFEYSFRGEKVQVYGSYGPNFGKYEIYIDDELVKTVNQKSSFQEKYTLQYTSDLLMYGPHTIKAVGIGNSFEIFKFAFWPSVKAKRINITDFSTTGTWKNVLESDNIGGVVKYTENNGAAALTNIKASKFWVYGTRAGWHNSATVLFGNHQSSINVRLSESNARENLALLHESPNLPLHNGEIKFTAGGVFMLSCIYYLEEETPTPEAPPVSIPVTSMEVTGDKDCNAETACPSGVSSYLCGPSCKVNTGSKNTIFKYTFKGEKVQIFGTYDSSYGKYEVYLDDKLVNTIDQHSVSHQAYSLQYSSPTLEYGEHTIKAVGIGNTFEIYKFAFWPSIKAKRINIADFTKEQTWKNEDDTIGGIVQYTDLKNGLARATITASKFWVYGTRAGWHGLGSVQFGTYQDSLNVHLSDNNARESFVLLCEALDVPFATTNLVLKSVENNYGKLTLMLNYVYYIDEPEPEQETVPISIPINEMNITRGTPECSAETECPSNAVSKIPCGQICLVNDAEKKTSFEFKFKGEKVQVFGSYSPDLSKYKIYIDDVFVKLIDQNSTNRRTYALQYTSDILTYGEHTVKAVGVGYTFEIYKFAYWPSLKAKRINATEFTLTGTWKNVLESDRIGGVVKYSEDDKATAYVNIEGSKFWVYGTRASWHSAASVQFGNHQSEIDVDLPVEGARENLVLLHESPDLPLSKDQLILKVKKTDKTTFMFSCIYYYAEPVPVPETIPVSVPITDAEVTGDAECSVKTACQDSISTSPCGSVCKVNTGNKDTVFKYTFIGEMVQVFGTYDPNFGEYEVYIDDELVRTVDQHSASSQTYLLQYTSPTLEYGEHTIKAVGIGNSFEIYKFTYWPSIKAKRYNISDMTVTGKWNKESDSVGGVRKYTADNGKQCTAYQKITASKFWVYGSLASWHGSMTIQFGEHQSTASEKIIGNRKDVYLVHESPNLPLAENTLTISSTDTVTINFIYYYDEPLPTATPAPVSNTVAFSVPTSSMKITGDTECSTETQCSADSISLIPCGQICKVNSGNTEFEYSFKGEKVEIYGNYGPNNGKYQVYIDGELIKTVNQNLTIERKYALQYTSDVLPYDEHTIKVVGIGETFEIYKFAFWPSLIAKRINITELQKNGTWEMESDGIGSLVQMSTQTNSYATINIKGTKFWVYGTRAGWHESAEVKFGSVEGNINVHLDDKDARENHVLLYESDEFQYTSAELTFKTGGEFMVICIYYIDDLPPQTIPPQTPTPHPTRTPNPELIPLSIPTNNMKITGESDCTCETETQCPSSISDFICGQTCLVNKGNKQTTFEYTFKGVKVLVYGTFDPNYGQYKIYIDEKFVETIDQHSETQQKYALQFTSDILPYDEHTIKVVGIGNTFEIYKFAYLPSIHAKRVNITEFSTTGTWDSRIETDNIGGVLKYTNNNGATAYTTIEGSKFWVYGTRAGWHNSGTVQFGNYNGNINVRLSNKDARENIVLIHESPDLPYINERLTLTSGGTFMLHSIYYLDEPVPATPKETPPLTATPLPTATANPFEYLIIEPIDCQSDGRYEKIVDNLTPTRIEIVVSEFNNIHHQDNFGGAIRIENSALICNTVRIEKCSSIEAGGAVYINNNNDMKKDVLLQNMYFKGCDAEYGGAVYIYSDLITDLVTVSKCVFEENIARGVEENSKNFGGSAIFINARLGSVVRCRFSKNIGEGGNVKIYNNFENNNNLLLLDTVPFSIKGCSFDLSKGANCALFYTRGKRGSSFELNDCSFTGISDSGSNYIMGKSISKNSPKIEVKRCKFDTDSLISLNMVKNRDFMNVDMKSQKFNFDEKKSFSSLVFLVSAIVLTAVIAAIAFIVKTMKSKKGEESGSVAEINDNILY